MDEFRNHILANLDVRDALIAGDSFSIAKWYNTTRATVEQDGQQIPAVKVVNRRVNRDGILDKLGLNMATSIIVILRGVAASQHEYAPKIAELVRLIDGGSGPDFGNTEIRLLINQLQTAQVLTEQQATALRSLGEAPVSVAEQILGKQVTADDMHEALRPVRHPGKTTLLPETLQSLSA